MINHKRPLPPRRRQMQQQRAQQQKAQPQNNSTTATSKNTVPLPNAAADNASTFAPAPPQNVGDLKNILNQYGNILSEENRGFISELISELEKGGDHKSLLDLAQRMQNAAQRQQKD